MFISYNGARIILYCLSIIFPINNFRLITIPLSLSTAFIAGKPFFL